MNFKILIKFYLTRLSMAEEAENIEQVEQQEEEVVEPKNILTSE